MITLKNLFRSNDSHLSQSYFSYQRIYASILTVIHQTSLKQTMLNRLFLENFLNMLYGTMGLSYNSSIM